MGGVTARVDAEIILPVEQGPSGVRRPSAIRSLELSPVDLMQLLGSVFDACEQPVFMIDARGRLNWSNSVFRDRVCRSSSPSPDALLRLIGNGDRERMWKMLGDGERQVGELEVEVEGYSPDRVTLSYTRLTPAAVVCVLASAAAVSADRVHRLEKVVTTIAATLGDIGLGPSSGDHREPLPEDLTDRQREVVELLFKSMSETDIAKVLFLSEHTVRNHKKAAFRRLGVHSKAELFSTFRAPDVYSIAAD